ncbi:AI-2E family transporter [Sphingobacterium paludis]|uniref:Putative PurR-regulated permease PerM n=1 Tax=Sphingobacterium paludis TaxID=1476465 RepID=A0A4V3E2K7_9SPHI|nr:AI-2E family transporter [Sphingobacterium paludis]TDS17608.1 putative PurR-regulated permease PerM [Sphingobacterium paludis]
MKESIKKLTVLGSFNQVLIFLVLLFTILHFAKSFLVPIVTSGLFAMLLVPVCHRLEHWGMKRGWAAVLVVLVTMLMIVGVLYVLVKELVGLGGDLVIIGDRVSEMLDQGHDFVSDRFHVSKLKQKEYLNKHIAQWSSSAGKMVGGAIFSTVSVLGNMLIITIYTILMLIYRIRIKRFVFQLVSQHAGFNEVSHARSIVEKITKVSSLYVGGIFLVVLILSIIYFVGLTIIGVNNALFFAILAALINVIPYIGSVAGGAIVVLYTLVTGDTLTLPIVVAIFFTAVQQLDSYVLTPKITGGQVKLGPLFTIMVLLLGGMLWGAAGMILFIPLLGIFKVIFDNVDPLKPYGHLIGD